MDFLKVVEVEDGFIGEGLEVVEMKKAAIFQESDLDFVCSVLESIGIKFEIVEIRRELVKK